MNASASLLALLQARQKRLVPSVRCECHGIWSNARWASAAKSIDLPIPSTITLLNQVNLVALIVLLDNILFWSDIIQAFV